MVLEPPLRSIGPLAGNNKPHDPLIFENYINGGVMLPTAMEV